MNKLGFGFLRLPQKNGDYDWAAINDMVDCFLSAGRRYFDTCYTYLGGSSERGIQTCLTSRYPREAYELCDKLPGYQCRTYDDCRRYFREQQNRCGVTWFDVYMLHWLNGENYETAERLDEFRFLRELKEQGLAGRIGFSYHDSPNLLDRILTAHPETDVVLLQLNYLDWESAGIASRQCYETCLRHGKSVIAMEPVKGGTLAKLPKAAESLLRAAHPDWSSADWALRFVQSLPGVETVLSGMNTLAQVQANVKEFAPLTQEEQALLQKVREIIEKNTAIGCTGCRYCEPHCPMRIAIPDYFRMYNEYRRFPEEDWKIVPAYRQLSLHRGKASECIGCCRCENHCPQHIAVSRHMQAVAAAFE